MLFTEKNLFVKHLTNQVVKTFLIDSEGMGLEFNNAAKLSINNKFKILNSKEHNYNDLIGSKIIKVEQTVELFRLSFHNGIIIEVGLKSEDYIWVEAIEIILPNQTSIIHRWGD